MSKKNRKNRTQAPFKLTVPGLKAEAKAQWYPFEGGELLIRWYLVNFLAPFIKAGTEPTDWQVFDYCLVDWRNVTDSDGKPVILTNATKRAVFDSDAQEIRTFVFGVVNNSNKRLFKLMEPVMKRARLLERISRN